MHLFDMFGPLHEGLIAIPDGLEAEIMRFVAQQVFWCLRDRFTPAVRKALPEHWTEFKATAKRWGVTIPREPYPKRTDGLVVKSYQFDPSKLAAQYRHLPADHSKIVVALDWQGTGPLASSGTALAFYKHLRPANKASYSAIVICLYRARALDRIPSRSHHPEEIGYVLNEITDSLRHELRHATQHIMLHATDPEQVKTLPDYKSHAADYYRSPIEFDPTIGSAVTEFVQSYGVISSLNARYPVTLANAIKIVVGAKPATIGNGYVTSAFFKTLRQHDRALWQVAVRKFVIGVQDALRAETNTKPSARKTRHA